MKAQRDQLWQQLPQQEFDVAIVGAGVSGAALFRRLSLQGYRCLLIDKGDFASGTSQASGMLIWGGLLYLKNLDLRTVVQLSRARDQLIRDLPGTVKPATFRYLSRLEGTRPGWLVRAALEAYWWLGGCRRKRPKRERYFEARKLLAEHRFGDSLTYEEGFLPHSDARLVQLWISEGLHADAGSMAVNYCRMDQAQLVPTTSTTHWKVQCSGLLPADTGFDETAEDPFEPVTIQARMLVNAAGVWADSINQQVGLQSSHRHVFSKGVYLGLPRPAGLREFLAFEMGAHGDTLTYTPWGPIALWGPTETPIESLDGAFTPTADDLRFLLETARANLRHQFMPQDIVSLRCGVRPLAVKRSYSGNDYPLDLSRRCVVDVDPSKPGLTLYGGKLTSAPKMAAEAAAEVAKRIGPGSTLASGSALGASASASARDSASTRAPAAAGIEDHRTNLFLGEVSLYDYLRRRTNIAQWTPRLGLGRHDEYRAFLRQLAERFHGADGAPLAMRDLELRAQAQDNLVQQIL